MLETGNNTNRRDFKAEVLFYLDTEHADHAEYLDHAEMKEKVKTWIGLRFIQWDRCG